MKKVLFVGGSGKLGSLALPILSKQYEATVFDIREPKPEAGATWIEGSVTDGAALREAASGKDALVYMAMVPADILQDVPLSYDINLKGLHLALDAAHQAGVNRVIFFSTGIVFDRTPYPVSDTMRPNPSGVYGMTKWLGEQVCEWYCSVHPMTVLAFRVWWPESRELWEKWHLERAGKPGGALVTWSDDLARAVAAGIEADAVGYHPILITGDYDERDADMSAARRVLGWRPTPGPTSQAHCRSA